MKIIPTTIIPTAIITAILLGSSVSGDEPVKLFNGKDLTGWTGADYEVKDGKLICRGKVLRTKKQYSDYILEFDFLLPPRGNNGLGIHYPGQGRPSGGGMELQILDNSHPKYAKLKNAKYAKLQNYKIAKLQKLQNMQTCKIAKLQNCKKMQHMQK